MMNNKHADMETAADIMNDDTMDKIAMLNKMRSMKPHERRDYLEYAINKKNNKNFETSPLTSRSIQYDGWNSTEWFETDIHSDSVESWNAFLIIIYGIIMQPESLTWLIVSMTWIRMENRMIII